MTDQDVAITRKNVELHGGTMDVETELGRGTRFHVDLPIDGCERASSAASRLANALAPHAPY